MKTINYMCFIIININVQNLIHHIVHTCTPERSSKCAARNEPQQASSPVLFATTIIQAHSAEC